MQMNQILSQTHFFFIFNVTAYHVEFIFLWITLRVVIRAFTQEKKKRFFLLTGVFVKRKKNVKEAKVLVYELPFKIKCFADA